MVDIEEKQSLRTNKCKSIGIIDEPVAPGATDFLDIKIHSKSLIDFVKDTNTPITIGVRPCGRPSLYSPTYFLPLA